MKTLNVEPNHCLSCGNKDLEKLAIFAIYSMVNTWCIDCKICEYGLEYIKNVDGSISKHIEDATFIFNNKEYRMERRFMDSNHVYLYKTNDYNSNYEIFTFEGFDLADSSSILKNMERWHKLIYFR